MNPDVNPVAEPSAAAPVQYDSWDEKGTPIVSAKTQPSKQDSAPADQEKPEKPDIAAESGAAKVQESKPKKDKLTADERIAQLEATIDKIRQSKGEQQPTKAAEPSTAKPATPIDDIKAELAALKKPELKDFNGTDGYERFEQAKDDWSDKRSELKSKLAKLEAKAEALDELRKEMAQAENTRKFNEELAKTKERRPDLEKVAGPAAQQIYNDPDVHGAVKQAFMKNPLLMDIMYVLGGDSDELAAFIALSKSDPIAAIQHIGELSHSIREELGKKTEAGKEQTRGEDGKFKAADKKETPVKPKPSAPEPVAIVGGRGTPGEDALVEAAKANRFSDFEAEQWRRVKSSRQ